MTTKTRGDILAERITEILKGNHFGAIGELIKALAEYGRPISTVEKWAAEMKAFTDGKVIECRHEIYEPQWAQMTNDVWLNHWEYRVKPTPDMVPLGPEDVPPGSASREIGCRTWRLVTEVESNGFSTHGENAGAFYGWGYAQKRLEISRDCGKTWHRCEKGAE